ncbi:helix-turn-helix domain-containing protein [Sphingobacterium lumbrici]|uniref:helix-turn-helix domain-containing protein n=1 Tax=Sphingobacterium lumbrici TaxID=2559600 RepID=UPI001C123FC0|nr:AraC family transcriptional regulator [Sphingobacterium lumbrici]
MENKHSFSEFTTPLPANSFFRELSAVMQYGIWNAGTISELVLPISGYLNILCIEEQVPCSYTLDDHQYTIASNYTNVHHVTTGQLLDISLLKENTKIIAFIVPQEYLDVYHIIELIHPPNIRVIRTNSSIDLLKQRIIDLYICDDLLSNIKIHSLLLEILTLQMEILLSENKSVVKDQLLEKVIQAKKIIQEDLTQNYSIGDLAKTIGTNEQYLKKYFKQHVGKTVMNFTLETKMLYAKNLIMTGKHRISDVARLTGYKHATHFTTAFKKYFGFIPNSLK